ncbi:MAG TPA: hypothetical protein VJY34_06395 [Roseiarcus sp.]|nr:hypothetical protein [Roseiarcus sp.]
MDRLNVKNLFFVAQFLDGFDAALDLVANGLALLFHPNRAAIVTKWLHKGWNCDEMAP